MGMWLVSMGAITLLFRHPISNLNAQSLNLQSKEIQPTLVLPYSRFEWFSTAMLHAPKGTHHAPN
jgi:hypothetical protein